MGLGEMGGHPCDFVFYFTVNKVLCVGVTDELTRHIGQMFRYSDHSRAPVWSPSKGAHYCSGREVGWWSLTCSDSNLNGRYSELHWGKQKLKSTMMMVKPY